MTTNQNSPKTCFVVMGFGKKTDFETGRTLDLDKSYQYLIKPAVEATGLTCIRADEIRHSGHIEKHMYQHLLNADVVVADLSTANNNAFYELGIRHALRPYTTVIIAEDGIKAFPFDVRQVAVRRYHHLGEDIGFGEVMRFQKALTEDIKAILARDPRDHDSPVYTFIEQLQPPSLRPAAPPSAPIGLESLLVPAPAAEAEVATRGFSFGPAPTAPVPEPEPTESVSELMTQVDQAQKTSDFGKARTLLNRIRTLMKKEGQPEEPYLIQKLALVTYKSADRSDDVAVKIATLQEARTLLLDLNPQTSNDTETLGLWGAVHKRLYDLVTNSRYLDEAIRSYERGFYLRNDYYNGVNLAYLLNVRAAQAKDRYEAITDFVLARRVRREVVSLCEDWLANNPELPEDGTDNPLKAQHREKRYWVLATLAEAYLGLEDEAQSQQWMDKALQLQPQGWMVTSTEDQLAKLRPLLAASPLARE